jgi:hypothetical protein
MGLSCFTLDPVLQLAHTLLDFLHMRVDAKGFLPNLQRRRLANGVIDKPYAGQGTKVT